MNAYLAPDFSYTNCEKTARQNKKILKTTITNLAYNVLTYRIIPQIGNYCIPRDLLYIKHNHYNFQQNLTLFFTGLDGMSWISKY